MPRPRLSLIALGWLWPDSGPHVRLRHFCGRRGRFLAAGGPGKAIGAHRGVGARTCLVAPLSARCNPPGARGRCWAAWGRSWARGSPRGAAMGRLPASISTPSTCPQSLTPPQKCIVFGRKMKVPANTFIRRKIVSGSFRAVIRVVKWSFRDVPGKIFLLVL